MNKRDILSFAFKIIGVYLAIFALASIPVLIFAFTAGEGMQATNFITLLKSGLMRVSVQLSPIFMFGFAIVLLKWGDFLAARLIKEDADVNLVSMPLDARSFFILSLRIVGVIQLVVATPPFITTLIENLCYWFVGYFPQRFDLLEAGIRVLVGLYLLSGARHLVAVTFKKAN